MSQQLNAIADLARVLLSYEDVVRDLHRTQDAAKAERDNNGEHAGELQRQASELQDICDQFEALRRKLSDAVDRHLPDVAKRLILVPWPSAGRWDRRETDWQRVGAELRDIRVEASSEQDDNVMARDTDSALTPRNRALALVVQHGDWTYKQIADAVGVHEGTVKRWPEVKRVKQQSRRYLPPSRGRKTRDGDIERW